MSPFLSRPPRAPRSHPVKPGATAPWVGEGTTATGKPTGGPRATGPDEERRANAGPRGTPERHAAGHNHSTRTGAKPQGPPGAANPGSAHNTRRTAARDKVPRTAGPPPPHTAPTASGKRAPAARPKGQVVGVGRAPDPGRPTPRQGAPPPGTLMPPPQRARERAAGLVTGPHARIPRTHSQWVVGPGRTPERTRGRGWESARPRTPHTQAEGGPPPGTLVPPPQHARARAVGLVTGPHARTPRTHSQWVAAPRRTPERTGGRGWESARPRTPHTQARGAPPGQPHTAPTARKSARCGVGDRSPRPHLPHPQSVGSVAHTHTRAHSTWPASLGSPPRGRAAGEGGAPDPRRPSQRQTAPPAGTPYRHPHGAQCRLARARAVGPVLGPNARTDRTRDTRVAEPQLPAPEDGRPGERQRLTPDAPHNGGRPPLQGTAPHHPRGTQPPQGMQAEGTVLGPHIHTPAPTARGWRTPTARPAGGQSGEEQRLTSDAPHNGGRHPPRGLPPAIPSASNAGPQGRTLWGRCWVRTPAPTAPGTHGSRNPGCPLQRTGGRGRDSA